MSASGVVAAAPAAGRVLPAGRLDQLPVGQLRRVADDPAVTVCRVGDAVFAFADTCPHQGGSLAEGRLVGDCVECPLHEARFRLVDGRPRGGPCRRPVPRYPVSVVDGQVFIRLPERSPGRRRPSRWRRGGR